MDKTTKAKLIEEIQNLPDDSAFIFVAAEPDEKEDAQTIIAVGCSLAELGGFICSALHDAFIEAGIRPRAGRAYADALCKTILKACASANAEVLKNLPDDERATELLGMMQDFLETDTEEGQTDAEG
ncbi:MAG: hypothetical protein SOR56_02210 [Oscillospiraceae bacterium]|nr:hypothetical protein [Collinsella sp.]MDY3079017.1 hypothetical protein [Oscillospiraceae bacterium]